MPWPELSEPAVGRHSPMWLLAYATVFSQLAFAFAIFSRRPRPWLLLVVLAFHVGIALMTGLTCFSWATAAGDRVFLADRFWLDLTEPVGGAARPDGRRRGGGDPAEASEVPPARPPAGSGPSEAVAEPALAADG